VNIVVNGCEPERVELAAAEIVAAYSVEVRAVTADPATETGRDRLLAAKPDPDILVTGGSQRELGDLARGTDDLVAAMRMHYMEQQYWAPVALAQAVVDGMRSRRFGRIVNIIPVTVPARRLVTPASSDGPRGMTAVMKGLAAQLADDNVTVNQLVTACSRPGAVLAMNGSLNKAVGAACAILCSTQANCISGMNLCLSGDHRRLELVS